MQINAVDGAGRFDRLARPQRHKDELAALEPTAVLRESATKAGDRVALSTTADAPVEADAPLDRDNGDKVPGVIRLLEAGHFKGVADVRLRINFFDELSQRAAESAAPAIQERSRDVIDAVGTKVDELVATFATDDETRAAVGDLVAEFESQVADAGTSDSLAVDLQAAFDALVDQMRALLTAPVAEEVADEDAIGDDTAALRGDTLEPTLAEATTVAVTETDTTKTAVRSPDATRTTGDSLADATDPISAQPVETTVLDAAPVEEEPAAEETQSLDDALASLREAFQEAFASLITAVDSSTLLADPAPSSGSGSAYDKFLAIYDDLRGLTTTVDESA